MVVATIDMYLYPVRTGVRFEIPDPAREGASLFDRSDFSPLQSVDIEIREEHGCMLLDGYILQDAYEIEIDADKQLEDYLYLLSYSLNFHRFSMPNCFEFFNKLKYHRTQESKWQLTNGKASLPHCIGEGS